MDVQIKRVKGLLRATHHTPARHGLHPRHGCPPSRVQGATGSDSPYTCETWPPPLTRMRMSTFWKRCSPSRATGSWTLNRRVSGCTRSRGEPAVISYSEEGLLHHSSHVRLINIGYLESVRDQEYTAGTELSNRINRSGTVSYVEWGRQRRIICLKPSSTQRLSM